MAGCCERFLHIDLLVLVRSLPAYVPRMLAHVPVCGDRRCAGLWDESLFSGKRWDERRLKDVLGETSDGAPRAEIRDPFPHYDNLSDTDRKLIGEFIRRNHPRMAHEFAVYGI